MELRLQVEELEYTVGKLSKIASDAKTTAGKEASNRQEATLHIKEKDRQIEQLERENSELSGECDELVQKMECFCEKVQELEAHMHSEASIKEGLENRLRELELRLSGGLKDPLLEQQLSSLSS
jgi:predicted RNase H-like nuclease (RuvC/YqgF family)